MLWGRRPQLSGMSTSPIGKLYMCILYYIYVYIYIIYIRIYIYIATYVLCALYSQMSV